MLRITIAANESWDELREEFVTNKEQTLQLEHSLVSLSKWESKWHKSFLNARGMTTEELLDYVRCMTLTQNVSPDIYYRITNAQIDEIRAYINAPMTATTFSEDKRSKPSREIITSELIYHWMIDAGIPFECQKWHLNRLLTLIRVRNVKNSKPKPMGKKALMSRNTALNAARRNQLHSRG